MDSSGNLAPSDPIEIFVNRNIPFDGNLPTENSAEHLTYHIEKYPKYGIVVLTDSAKGHFRYITYSEESDFFSYTIKNASTTLYSGQVNIYINENGPLFKHQWYLKNSGQTAHSSEGGAPGEDIRLHTTHEQGITGENITVAIIDEGLEILHEDLTDNILPGGSYNFIDGSNDPSLHTSQGDHGTSVAGILAASAMNGIGIRGVAPKAKIRAFNFLASDQITENLLAVNGLTNTQTPFDLSDVDIINKSFGSNPRCNYTSMFGGTSAATPIVSGVIALLLQTNPNLSWRDVKHILLTTARKIDANNPGIKINHPSKTYIAEYPWLNNSAGYSFHNWYGFGAIHASDAVTIAQSYTSYLPALRITDWIGSNTLNMDIPDLHPEGISHELTIEDDIIIEAVQIKTTISHDYIGDIGIEIKSPSGMKSILLNTYNGFTFDDDLDDFVMLSHAFYGENSAGKWKIKVMDGNKEDQGQLEKWEIRFFGHSQ